MRYARACSSCGFFYSEDDTPSKYAFRTGIRQRKLEIVIEEVLWSIRGSYQTIWSSALSNVKWHSVASPDTMTTLHRLDYILIRDLVTELDLSPNYKRFPYLQTFTTGITDACSSGHLVQYHLALAYDLLVETNPLSELVIFPDYSLRTAIGTLSILLLNYMRKRLDIWNTFSTNELKLH